MSKTYDRPATNPGGMECLECGVIFVGEEWHGRCALCEDKPWNRFLGELETWCCELPDRSSPDNAPEMMLIDRQELVMLAVKVRDFTIRQFTAEALSQIRSEK